jgi:acylphosphatase
LVGVFFRKYTQSKARELGLIGWVKNTEKGTVLGQAEGDSAAIASMKNWLCNVGSPSSKIEKCDIKEYGELELSHLKDFVVVA